MFIHYVDMLENTEKSIRQIASFLEIPIQEELLPGILEAVSFEGMRKNLLCLPAEVAFKEGNKSFIHKDQNGCWKGVLTPEQLAKYDRKVKEKLTPECAAWLEEGVKGFYPKTS
jgi:aryl sulfotransferase